ncbi:MAG: hypothetical protein IT436_07130 [Phycisphaerales bacterium]|nr:hypothetical protein [Phycisphaerales bacterium]
MDRGDGAWWGHPALACASGSWVIERGRRGVDGPRWRFAGPGHGLIGYAHGRAGPASAREAERAGLMCKELGPAEQTGCMRVNSADPDILVDLTTARTEIEAQGIADALGARGIPAKVFANAGMVIAWDAAGQSIRVAVRRRDLEDARTILRELPAEAVRIDWSRIDTGDPTPPEDDREVCSQCGYALHGTPEARRCPECGAAIEPTQREMASLPEDAEVAWRKPVIGGGSGRARWKRVEKILIGLMIVAGAVWGALRLL